MLTTLVATLCHMLVSTQVCVEEIIANSDTDPNLTWMSCQTEAQQGIAMWLKDNPKYHDWRLAGWKCVPGRYIIPGSAALTPLLVHSWYPMECCGGKECRPVPCDSLVETKEGVVWEGLTFRNKQIRPSLDSQCHVCFGAIQPGQPLSPYCVFVQPSS